MRDCAFHYRSRFGVFGELIAVPGWVLVFCTLAPRASSNFRSDKASTRWRAAKVDAAVERAEQLNNYSFLPLAGWPRRRNVLGYFPLPLILKEPKSLYQGPSGASGSDSRHSFNWYKSSALIRRSRRRSNKWSRRAAGKSVYRILGIYFPNVMRANSALIRLRSAGFEVALN